MRILRRFEAFRFMSHREFKEETDEIFLKGWKKGKKSHLIFVDFLFENCNKFTLLHATPCHACIQKNFSSFTSHRFIV